MMLWTAPPPPRKYSMQAVTTVGLDIAKSVFQVHGVDAAGQVVGIASAAADEDRSHRAVACG